MHENAIDPILKNLKPLNRASSRDFNLTHVPKPMVPIIATTMTNAAILTFGYNPTTQYSISKDTLIDEIDFKDESSFSRMQDIAVPFEDDFVEKLINCPKVQVKSKRLTYVSRENKNNYATETRTLLIAKVDGQYVALQLNFRTEYTKSGRVVKFGSNLGLLVNGKDYAILERYDVVTGHMNFFLDKYMEETDIQEEKFISSPAHLHLYNKRVLTSLFDAAQQEGYDPAEILTSKFMTKQEAIPFRTFQSDSEAIDFFNEIYNIDPGSRENKNIKNISVKDVLENVSVLEERPAEEASPNNLKQTNQNEQDNTSETNNNHNENIEL